MLSPLRLAFSLNVARRHHEAADSARRALEIDPNYHLMWRELGAAQIHLGSIPDAVSSFGRPVELAPCISHGQVDNVIPIKRLTAFHRDLM
jgi:hypothetical protein